MPDSFIKRILKLGSWKKKSEFSQMTPEQKKARVDYLWRKVRMVVLNKALWASIQQDAWNVKRAKFNLSDDSYLVGTDEEVEMDGKYKKQESRTSSGLPWYLIDQNSTLAILHKTTVELLTLTQMYITPLTLVFDQFKADVIYLQLVFDFIWIIGIILTFFTASAKHRTLQTIAKQYLISGLFFIDIISTMPGVLTLEKNNAMSLFKFLRLVRFSDMFNPVLRLMRVLMPQKSSFEIADTFELLVIFSAVVLIAHMSACMWIFLGHWDDHLPLEDRHTWRFNQAFGADFAGYHDYQEYVFAVYWVLEAITTVGYGDYAGAAGNTNEYLFTLLLEFTGVAFFSAMTYKMQSYAQRAFGFDTLLTLRMEQLRIWMQKLEDSHGLLHISPGLYSDIILNVEFAFIMDFNMIIEEHDFYFALTPKMQTDLINFLFFDFKKQYASFFDPCEQGFTNELIVNLYARNQPPNQQLAAPGRKMEEFYFISEGYVSVNGPRIMQPFLILPQYSYLGDYQILFNLKSTFSFKVYIPPANQELTLDMISQSGVPPLQAQTQTSNLMMCVDADTFLRIA